MFSSLLATGSSGSGVMIIWIVVLFAVIWLLMLRPQRKQEKQKRAMLEAMEIGDTVMTNGGMYGTLIDVQDDTVIVEFGNNKNCRIPMQKAAIAEVEKASDAVDAPEEK